MREEQGGSSPSGDGRCSSRDEPQAEPPKKFSPKNLPGKPSTPTAHDAAGGQGGASPGSTKRKTTRRHTATNADGSPKLNMKARQRLSTVEAVDRLGLEEALADDLIGELPRFGEPETKETLDIEGRQGRERRPSFSTAKDTLRKSFRKKALHVHPDKGGSHTSFLDVQEAYEKLVSKARDIRSRGSVKQAADEVSEELHNVIGVQESHHREPQDNHAHSKAAVHTHVFTKESHHANPGQKQKPMLLHSQEQDQNCRDDVLPIPDQKPASLKPITDKHVTQPTRDKQEVVVDKLTAAKLAIAEKKSALNELNEAAKATTHEPSEEKRWSQPHPEPQPRLSYPEPRSPIQSHHPDAQSFASHVVEIQQLAAYQQEHSQEESDEESEDDGEEEQAEVEIVRLEEQVEMVVSNNGERELVAEFIEETEQSVEVQMQHHASAKSRKSPKSPQEDASGSRRHSTRRNSSRPGKEGSKHLQSAEEAQLEQREEGLAEEILELEKELGVDPVPEVAHHKSQPSSPLKLPVASRKANTSRRRGSVDSGNQPREKPKNAGRRNSLAADFSPASPKEIKQKSSSSAKANTHDHQGAQPARRQSRSISPPSPPPQPSQPSQPSHHDHYHESIEQPHHHHSENEPPHRVEDQHHQQNKADHPQPRGRRGVRLSILSPEETHEYISKQLRKSQQLTGGSYRSSWDDVSDDEPQDLQDEVSHQRQQRQQWKREEERLQASLQQYQLQEQQTQKEYQGQEVRQQQYHYRHQHQQQEQQTQELGNAAHSYATNVSGPVLVEQVSTVNQAQQWTSGSLSVSPLRPSRSLTPPVIIADTPPPPVQRQVTPPPIQRQVTPPPTHRVAPPIQNRAAGSNIVRNMTPTPQTQGVIRSLTPPPRNGEYGVTSPMLPSSSADQRLSAPVRNKVNLAQQGTLSPQQTLHGGQTTGVPMLAQNLHSEPLLAQSLRSEPLLGLQGHAASPNPRQRGFAVTQSQPQLRAGPQEFSRSMSPDRSPSPMRSGAPRLQWQYAQAVSSGVPQQQEFNMANTWHADWSSIQRQPQMQQLQQQQHLKQHQPLQYPSQQIQLQQQSQQQYQNTQHLQHQKPYQYHQQQPQHLQQHPQHLQHQRQQQNQQQQQQRQQYVYDSPVRSAQTLQAYPISEPGSPVQAVALAQEPVQVVVRAQEQHANHAFNHSRADNEWLYDLPVCPYKVFRQMPAMDQILSLQQALSTHGRRDLLLLLQGHYENAELHPKFGPGYIDLDGFISAARTLTIALGLPACDRNGLTWVFDIHAKRRALDLPSFQMACIHMLHIGLFPLLDSRIERPSWIE
eukprot:gnl/MRDRNA2_/MRDRNA2_81608_c0_seq1.p1 gnl/MRDRNA2_/MRDRNA2_81608_c0~~gnl/MRDRNA2_/MRDRNA2_81608_c0_seq1.p1  ORF type:complete len:1310 (+),score=288.96 gnl/MRDRNA2_/MRDRNA2_81608_c0_seq1:2-3931(+)